jgi:CBS domain-containing protein
MKMRDVMTDQVITVGKNDDLKHVMDLMEKHNITKVPVLSDGKLVGIVTDNMIAKKLGSSRKRGIKPSGIHASSVMEKDFEIAHPDAPLLDWLPKVGLPGLTMIPVVTKGQLIGVHTKANLLPLVDDEGTVADIMSPNVKTVSPDDRLVHARRILLDNEIARVPVVDGNRVIGILHEAQIAHAFAALLKDVPFEHQQARVRELIARDWMKSPVVTIQKDASLKEAAKTMMEKNIGGLPVLDDDEKLVGWLTRTDLAKTIRLSQQAEQPTS